MFFIAGCECKQMLRDRSKPRLHIGVDSLEADHPAYKFIIFFGPHISRVIPTKNIVAMGQFGWAVLVSLPYPGISTDVALER